MTITEGKKAPKIKLKDKEGIVYSLSDFTEKYIVIFFYPKDDTPGCTIETKEFSKNLAKFAKENIKVIGISGGDEKTKQKFCDKYNLKVLLLSDTDFKVADSYGVYGEKQFMGKKYMGISRTTFILDEDRKIIKVFEAVKPEGHTAEVLEFIKVFDKS